MNKHPKSEYLELVAHNKHLSIPNIIFIETIDPNTKCKVFSCKTTIMINDISIMLASHKYNKKKDCEYDIYFQILQYIKTDIEYNMLYGLNIVHDTLIIVDYENVSAKHEISKLDTLQKVLNMDRHCDVVKFAGKLSPVSHLSDIVVESTRKNAVDHYISFYLGMCYDNISKDTLIFILTKDHFASCLDDMYENIYHVVSVQDIINKLDEEGKKLKNIL